MTSPTTDKNDTQIQYVDYKSEEQLAHISGLIEEHLSEPYSIFTYRYFVNTWPNLAILAMDGDRCVGCLVAKLAPDKKQRQRGYIAMLAVHEAYRKRGIGSSLVTRIVERMKALKADLVVLETEVVNTGAQNLYERLGFTRDKRMQSYYMNGVDAFRLKLWLTPPPPVEPLR